MIDYTLILITKYKGKFWSLSGDNYEGLKWLSESPKPTKEELDSQWEEVQSIVKKGSCKSKAKELIAQSDWSVLPDVKIQNKTEFENYRSILRELILNPTENPVFPTEPLPIWIFTTKTMGDNNG